MENLGIISRVEKPTSWCAGMVVVPKKSGDVRICVDGIEKEALASTWVCEKFRNYILGKSFIESDHKPLIPLLNTKHLDDMQY